MQAVILAAGRGTRMEALTDNLPKPLLGYRGKSLLEHRLDILPAEITEVVLVIGYKGECIKKKFGDRYAGRSITYVWQKNLDGTAGALHQAKSILQDRFLVLLGDDVFTSQPIKTALENDWAMTGVMVPNDGQTEHMHVDSSNRLVHFKPVAMNKQTTVMMDAGIHVIGKDFFEYPPQPVPGKTGKETGIPQTLAAMASEVIIKVSVTNQWSRITAPQDLEK